MEESLQFGDVVFVGLPKRYPQGHEQEGSRPAIVVGNPDFLGMPHFSTVVVVPLTRLTPKKRIMVSQSPHLYPIVYEGEANIDHDSVVLLNQITTVDVRRIISCLGKLSPTRCLLIEKHLKSILSFQM